MRMKMKEIRKGWLGFPVGLALVMLVGLFPAAEFSEASPKKRLSFSGGSPGGNFNLFTTAMSPILTAVSPKVSVFPEASTGSPENVRRINAGETDMGLAFSSDLTEAWNGEGRFKAPLRNMRALAFVESNVAHMVTLTRSKITRLEDLFDMRIALGPPGSGSAMNAERFFRHLGVWERIRKRAVFMGAMDMSQALKDGHIDAYNWHVNVGNATYHDTASTHDITIIDLDTPARTSGFYEKFPFFSPFSIPGGIYRSVDKPVNTWMSPTFWIVPADFPEDLAYELLKIAFSDDSVRRMHDAMGLTARLNFGRDKGFAKHIPIPLHPGAVRFWKEQGHTIPAGR